jgi:hypothetical protein
MAITKDKGSSKIKTKRIRINFLPEFSVPKPKTIIGRNIDRL